MATREFPAVADIVCDVDLKDGRFWRECDMAQHANNAIVAFWLDEKNLLAVPLQDVSTITFYEREK
jgi:hypothetical protein